MMMVNIDIVRSSHFQRGEAGALAPSPPVPVTPRPCLRLASIDFRLSTSDFAAGDLGIGRSAFLGGMAQHHVRQLC